MAFNEYSQGTGWGQNMYAWYSSDPADPGLTSQAAIDSWYNGEFRNYDAYGDAGLLADGESSPPPAVPGGVYGHFTQVIWKVRAHTPRDVLSFYTGSRQHGPREVFIPKRGWVKIR